MKNIIFCLIIAIFIGGCTWVKLTLEGEKVRVLSLEEVATCKKLGKATTRLKDKIAGVKRGMKKVIKEMQTLARNSAVDMNGDTVVPISEIEDGKQVFAVYRCVGQ